MKFNCKEDIIQITPNWEGERLPDGRPMVSADVLERLRKITLEEAWGPLWGAGYKYQYQGNFHTTHPGKTLVGRAVTATMVPMRPDLHEYLLKYGHEEEGRKGFFNQWVIDSLIEDDVVVVDMFDKIFQGTYVGGNLSTAIANRTKRGGAVVWGGIRDMEQIVQIPNIQEFYRGVDPTGIADVTMTSFNGPTRIGNATCLPGDVVLGTISGVIFIPAHMAEKVAIGAEKSHIRDVFGFQRLEEKVYTTAQVDARWTLPMWEDFINWFKTEEAAKEFQHLDWAEELKEAQDYAEKAANAADVRL